MTHLQLSCYILTPEIVNCTIKDALYNLKLKLVPCLLLALFSVRIFYRSFHILFFKSISDTFLKAVVHFLLVSNRKKLHVTLFFFRLAY